VLQNAMKGGLKNEQTYNFVDHVHGEGARKDCRRRRIGEAPLFFAWCVSPRPQGVYVTYAATTGGIQANDGLLMGEAGVGGAVGHV
jgi:hypothetical protein